MKRIYVCLILGISLVVGVSVVQSTQSRATATAAVVPPDLSAVPPSLAPYLPMAEAARQASTISARSMLNLGSGVSTSVTDSAGKFELSLNAFPAHPELSILVAASSTGMTQWVVNNASGAVEGGPYPTAIEDQAVAHVQIPAPGAGGSSTSSTNRSAAPGSTAGTNSVIPQNGVIDYCDLVVELVGVVGGGFGPLLDGYEYATCDFPTNMFLGAQFQQVGLDLLWHPFGPIGSGGGSGLEANLTLEEGCHIFTQYGNFFRLHGWALFEFDGVFGSADQNGQADKWNCQQL